MDNALTAKLLMCLQHASDKTKLESANYLKNVSETSLKPVNVSKTSSFDVLSISELYQFSNTCRCLKTGTTLSELVQLLHLTCYYFILYILQCEANIMTLLRCQHTLTTMAMPHCH